MTNSLDSLANLDGKTKHFIYFFQVPVGTLSWLNNSWLFFLRKGKDTVLVQLILLEEDLNLLVNFIAWKALIELLYCNIAGFNRITVPLCT